MYLQDERESERFWTSLHRDLRNSGSVFGLAIDGLIARKGAVFTEEFVVTSGATTVPIKKQITAATVLKRLKEAGLVEEVLLNDRSYVYLKQTELGVADIKGVVARDTVEKIILDALRTWTRNLGAASFNQIAIRGDENLVPIHQFKFDLAGPSYLLPLRGMRPNEPGFLAADVFSDGLLDEFHIRYFVRKARALNSTMSKTKLLPFLVAEGFTGEALTAGHAAGLLMGTPSTIFGKNIGNALRNLLTVLSNAAAYASADKPDRLISLVNALAEIEGRSNNLRGPLFELLIAYLVRRDAVSIDMGIHASDPISGEKADIDILKVLNIGKEFIAIECKAREPGGSVNAKEVQHWLNKIKVIKNYLKQNRDREAKVTFEIWTTGDFTQDAQELLCREQQLRTKTPISWKTGNDVITYAQALREKAVAEVMKQHFTKHPILIFE